MHSGLRGAAQKSLATCIGNFILPTEWFDWLCLDPARVVEPWFWNFGRGSRGNLRLRNCSRVRVPLLSTWKHILGFLLRLKERVLVFCFCFLLIGSPVWSGRSLSLDNFRVLCDTFCLTVRDNTVLMEGLLVWTSEIGVFARTPSLIYCITGSKPFPLLGLV